MMRRMFVKHQSRCTKCSASILAGDIAFGEKANGAKWALWCVTCFEGAPVKGTLPRIAGDPPYTDHPAIKGRVTYTNNTLGVSYTDAADYIADAFPDDPNGDKVRNRYVTVSQVAQYRELALHGWTEGAQRIAAIREDFELPRLPSRTRRARWSDEGEDFDKDRLEAGRDDYWRTSSRERGNGGMPGPVRLIVNVDAPGAVSDDAWFYTGAGAVRLVDELELAGYPCEVWTVIASRSQMKAPGMLGPDLSVRVKACGEPMLAERLAAFTAHSGALRSAYFNWCRYLPWKVNSNGIVSARWPEPADPDIKTLRVPRLYTQAGATEWLVDVLHKVQSVTYAELDFES